MHRRRVVKVEKASCVKPSSPVSCASTDDLGSSRCSSTESVAESFRDSWSRKSDSVHGARHLRGVSVQTEFVVERQVLGSGMSGEVVVARRRSDGAKFAVKRFDTTRLSLSALADLRREVDIYLGLDHPHVAQLERVFETDSEVSLVMECLEGGDVFDRLAEHGRYSEEDAAEILRQMLLAVDYLHRQNIVHCDLKAENFVYADKACTQVKLIDFGLAKRWDGVTKLRSRNGTLRYQAPEVFGDGFTCKADMWSLGVLAYVLLCAITPFVDDEVEATRLVHAGSPRYSRSRFFPLSSAAKHFTRSLLIKDESLRASATEALQHPWLCNSR